MGRKIFITYGDELYAANLSRITQMAKQTEQFDIVIPYTHKDLPENLLNHPLFKYQRGGGYWLWKPYIIMKTLEQCSNDDIVIYVDAGSEVFKDSQWQKYFTTMKKSSAIVFKFCCLMKHWTKKKLLDRFKQDCHNIHQMHQILSGFSLWSRQALPFVKEWFEVMYHNPDLVIDTPDDELKYEAPCFIEHRHDQAVLTCLAYKYEQKYNIKILWEKSEVFYSEGQAIFFSRMRLRDGQLKGKARCPVSLIWRLRHKLVEFVRDVRQFFYRHIF